MAVTPEDQICDIASVGRVIRGRSDPAPATSSALTEAVRHRLQRKLSLPAWLADPRRECAMHDPSEAAKRIGQAA